MSELAELLLPLAHLERARGDAGQYYAALLTREDEVTRVGAWCALVERDAIEPDQYPMLIEVAARYGAVRSGAFRFFENAFEHDRAADIAGAKVPSEADAETAAMLAELADEAASAEDAARRRYLANGRFDLLLDLSQAAEHAGGWQRALPVTVTMLVLFPHEPIAANRLLAILNGARRADLLDAVLQVLDRSGLHPYLAGLYRAAWQLMQGEARAALTTLGKLGSTRPTRPDVLDRVRPLAGTLTAEAHEKLGDYQRAFTVYTDRNKLGQDRERFSLDELPRITLEAASRAVPALPADPLGNYFVMTGFPRSGTTLLENALAAHPDVETFEEIPSRASVEKYLQRPGRAANEPVERYLTARQRYYDEIERRRHKPTARVFVDKMPMRSIEAGFMSKLFPDKRYIFSIRHPYDVVLSCFKQDFGRNIAMEHFRSFDGAAKLYDFTMRQWFRSYGLDDPRVHYLRYDDLVTAFEPSIRSTLEFLGVPWDAQVLNFAELADTRSTRTPSYQKVRQGLTIGVQSQWRNYGFLFQSDAAKPLLEWARFFGYPTE